MRSSWAITLAVAMLAVPLVGCIGSGDESVEQASTNVSKTNETPETSPLPDTITGLTELATVETKGSGTGIWIDEQRDVLISANGGGGLQLYDVSQPDNVTELGSIEDIYARDADLLRWNGTPYAILAGGGDGIHVVDISDPTSPEITVTADKHSSHNVAAVHGTPYVYDATAVGVQGKAENPIIPVLDLTNPTDPAWETIEIPSTVNGQPIQSDGCHDLYVREDLGQAFCAGGGSMYAAGGGESFVWDISDGPLQPTWTGVIDNPSIVYHHQAIPSEDGNLLFINDEHIAPNCNGAEAGPAEAKQSTAAMWIYDISDPANPEMRSYVQVTDDEVNSNCGSHFGDLVDGRDFVVWGWYQAGTLLIDVSNPDDPQITSRVSPDGATWDAKYYEGHVYGSSGNLQVLDITGE